MASVATADEAMYELGQAVEYNGGGGRGFSDISRLLAWWYAPSQGYDDRDGVWLVEFKDEVRGLYIGGHDSTGWDCQSNLNLFPFDGWEERLRESDDIYEDGLTAPRAEVIAHLTAQLGSSR